MDWKEKNYLLDLMTNADMTVALHLVVIAVFECSVAISSLYQSLTDNEVKRSGKQHQQKPCSSTVL